MVIFRPSQKISNLRLRVMSSLILAPLMLLAVYIGGSVYDLIVTLIMLQAMREWLLLVDPQAGRHLHRLTAGIAFTSLLVCLGLALTVSITAAAGAGTLLTLGLFLLTLPSGQKRALWVAGSIPYVAGCGVALLYLHHLPEGKLAVTYLLLVVWATDIGAYFTGRTLGGPKLAPVISPNKTWSGLGGGMTLAALAGYGVATYAALPQAIGAAGLAVVIALVAQIGDLFESIVKRQSNVKDSSHMIPGHGGVLDRIDGLIFAAVFLAAIHKISQVTGMG